MSGEKSGLHPSGHTQTDFDGNHKRQRVTITPQGIPSSVTPRAKRESGTITTKLKSDVLPHCAFPAGTLSAVGSFPEECRAAEGKRSPINQCCNDYKRSCILPSTQVMPGVEKDAIGGFKAVLPGHGEVSSEFRCGKVETFHRCVNGCGKAQPIKYNCHNIHCPVCFRSAVHQMGKRIDKRLSGLCVAYLAAGVKLGKVKHTVWSVDPLRYPIEYFEADRGARFLEEMRGLLKRFAKDGAYAGVIILHLWRKKHEDGTECERNHCHRKHIWEYGPHVHFVGHGYFAKSNIVHEKTGWVYKNVQPGKARSVYETVFYLCTHLAVFVEQAGNTVGQSYRYVGLFSNAKGGYKVVSKERVACLCLECKDEIHKYGMDMKGDMDKDYDMGAVEVTREIVAWYLNMSKGRKRKFRQEQIGEFDDE
jgi:hypothetical protein